jgi:hypothetical protein
VILIITIIFLTILYKINIWDWGFVLFSLYCNLKFKDCNLLF